MRLHFPTLLHRLTALVCAVLSTTAQARDNASDKRLTAAPGLDACAVKPTGASDLPSAGTVKPGVDYQCIAPRKIFDLVMKLAPQFKVDPQLALAIMAAESNFDSQALSPNNAQGLMQLVPATSERFKVTDAFDPVQNIRGGLTYLRWLLAYFEGDVALVAAAYNAGEGNVARYRGVPPYLKTQAYVQKILTAFGTAVHPFDPSITRSFASLNLSPQ